MNWNLDMNKSFSFKNRDKLDHSKNIILM